jgi:uncharacterized FlgJ-related protein
MLRTFKVSLLILILHVLPTEIRANKKLTENYIFTFKNIAISEMKRSGIPASIKLAQGIIESDLGRSPLAIVANNHFGIKCGSNWSGGTYYKVDDDKDSTGTLIHSCFRSFVDAEESYRAHSEFLMNPSKSSRYGFLFKLGSTDYEGWAHGLKYAGYATDPTYPDKLIKVIEKYNLSQYDEHVVVTQENFDVVNEKESNGKKDKMEPQIVKADQKPAKGERQGNKSEHTKKSDRKATNKPTNTKYKSNEINGLAMTNASGHETVKAIASRTGSDVFDLLEYNEGLSSPDYVPYKDEIVFLEKKKKNIEGETVFHTFREYETMYSVSQQYGIRLESLLAKNNLKLDDHPLSGEQISLVRQLPKKETPRHKQVERFDAYIDLGGLK